MTSIQRVSIIGCGMMGQGIAVDFAVAGRDVTIFNTRAETSQQAMANIRAALSLMVNTGLISQAESEAALQRVKPTTDLEAAAVGQQYVVETVLEDMALKHRIFRDLERFVAPDTILTTDTSSLPMEEIAWVLERPERLVATPYFYPAHLVPLVEVAPTQKTKPDVIETTSHLLKECGKWPVVIERPLPGFIGNRLQAVMRSEALKMVEAGEATPEMVDQVLTMGILRKYVAVGIFDRMDMTGLDLQAAVFQSIGKEVPKSIAERVARGDYGVKTGRGFYEWTPESARELQERLDRRLIYLIQEDRKTGRTQVPSPGTK